MATSTPITVAHGDGIGPEIMAATLHILKGAGARLEIETIEIGEKVYLERKHLRHRAKFLGFSAPDESLFKGAHHHPPGRRLQESQRYHPQDLGLYANIRPCVSYYPFVRTKHPVMDVVIVRENEEDLYAGIEYQATPG